MITAPIKAFFGGNDLFFDNTIVLLSGNGVNNSEIFTDESFAQRGNADQSALGAVRVNTANALFGSGAMRFDGDNDFLSYPDHADFTFGTSNFTLENWVKFTGTESDKNKTQPLLAHHDATGNQRGWNLAYYGGDDPNTLDFRISLNGSSAIAICSYEWTPELDVWYFIACDRDGSDFRLYLGEYGETTAAMVASGSNAGSIFNSSAQFRIGSFSTPALFEGYMEEIRVTLGVARYASDAGCPIPTEAWPRG